MQKIYKGLPLEMVNDSEEQPLDAVIKPRGGDCACVQGARSALSTPPSLLMP